MQMHLFLALIRRTIVSPTPTRVWCDIFLLSGTINMHERSADPENVLTFWATLHRFKIICDDSNNKHIVDIFLNTQKLMFSMLQFVLFFTLSD